MHHLGAAYSRDVEIRIEDEKLPREHAAITTEECDQDGVVYKAAGLRVIAFTVDHGGVLDRSHSCADGILDSIG